MYRLKSERQQKQDKMVGNFNLMSQIRWKKDKNYILSTLNVDRKLNFLRTFWKVTGKQQHFNFKSGKYHKDGLFIQFNNISFYSENVQMQTFQNCYKCF